MPTYANRRFDPLPAVNTAHPIRGQYTLFLFHSPLTSKVVNMHYLLGGFLINQSCCFLQSLVSVCVVFKSCECTPFQLRHSPPTASSLHPHSHHTTKANCGLNDGSSIVGPLLLHYSTRTIALLFLHLIISTYIAFALIELILDITVSCCLRLFHPNLSSHLISNTSCKVFFLYLALSEEKQDPTEIFDSSLVGS